MKRAPPQPPPALDHMRWAIFLLLVTFSYATLCGDIITCSQDICTPGAEDGEGLLNTAVCDSIPTPGTGGGNPKSCVLCGSGLHCDATATCVPVLGRACTTDAQCRSHIPDFTEPPMTCSGTCQIDLAGALYHGAYCASTAECAGVMTCQNTTGELRCENPGPSCTDDFECGSGLWCTGSTCTARSTSRCASGSSRECVAGKVCRLKACVEPGSILQGKQCEPNEEIDEDYDGFDPVLTYGCISSLQCRRANSTSSKRICTTKNSLLGDSCIAELLGSCGLDAECACDRSTAEGKCVAVQEVVTGTTAWRVLRTCQLASGCRDEELKLFDGTCTKAFCATEFGNWFQSRPSKFDYGPSTCLVSNNVLLAASIIDPPLVTSGASCVASFLRLL